MLKQAKPVEKATVKPSQLLSFLYDLRDYYYDPDGFQKRLREGRVFYESFISYQRLPRYFFMRKLCACFGGWYALDRLGASNGNTKQHLQDASGLEFLGDNWGVAQAFCGIETYSAEKRIQCLEAEIRSLELEEGIA